MHACTGYQPLQSDSNTFCHPLCDSGVVIEFTLLNGNSKKMQSVCEGGILKGLIGFGVTCGIMDCNEGTKIEFFLTILHG